MMGEKYAPVPANNGLVAGNPAINTPDTLRAWLRAKYQRETVGNQQSAIQRLTQERYQPYDTPDTYEARIRPLLLGVADNDVQVLGFLKSHLTGDFYTWMKIANPGGINAFFTELKNMWLEHGQNLSGRISEESNQFANQALPSINPVSYSLPQVTPVSQPAFTKDDVQKVIQDALAQQKTENQALVKKVTELQSQMSQQTQVSAPRPITIKPQVATVGNFQPPPIMYLIKSEKAQHAFYIVDQKGNYIDPNQETDYHKYIVQAYNSLKRPQRNNNSARFNRIEEGLDETRDAVNETRDSINQLSNQFQKLNIHKLVARSNFNRGYFKPITPINFQHTPPALDNEEDDYDKVENAWYYTPEKK
ncbi:hypothetical protein RclHR1_20600008 [Rhizophagus clarus]|uniref:Uncharacterized protein n=1 Tax=Rhizophagus clarus TaxID=94130 RepID=A0A2Z6QQY0_9GLOM|nr:hypothetical protein RclHR1_20600008 [Rhizophagus clarus]